MKTIKTRNYTVAINLKNESNTIVANIMARQGANIDQNQISSGGRGDKAGYDLVMFTDNGSIRSNCEIDRCERRTSDITKIFYSSDQLIAFIRDIKSSLDSIEENKIVIDTEIRLIDEFLVV